MNAVDPAYFRVVETFRVETERIAIQRTVPGSCNGTKVWDVFPNIECACCRTGHSSITAVAGHD